MMGRGQASPDGWKAPYVWLQIFAFLEYLLLGCIITLGAVHYLRVLDVGYWYGPQVMAPTFTLVTAFLLGDAPFTRAAIGSTRWWVGTVVSFVCMLAMVGAGIAFMVIQGVYVGTSADCSSLIATSICASSSRKAAFGFVMAIAAVLVVLGGLAAYVIAYQWYRHTKDRRVE